MSACMFVMTSGRVLRDHMKRCRDYAIAGGCSICCAPIDPNVRQRAITRTRYVSDISDAAALAATLPVDRDAVAQQALADLRLNYCDNTNDTSVAYALRCCDAVLCDGCCTASCPHVSKTRVCGIGEYRTACPATSYRP